MEDIQSIKTKKWFKKWWGIAIIVFGILIVLIAIYFVSLVFRYKKGIELGDIIISNPVGGYSEFDNSVNSQVVINRSEIEDSDNPSLGANDPIMTIVEFSDFNCPYCAVFYPTLKDFALEYPDKVKLIFRDFALSGNEPALAANCAFEQGRFWEMHDKLFNNQGSLSESNIKNIAESMRLDMDVFNNCYDNEKYQGDIQKDLALGVKAGVEGTPTMFINGEKFVGVIPKTILERILYAIEYGSEQ
jgi:protein-disulfide isomerase